MAYSAALRQHSQHHQAYLLHLNRAAALLRLERFSGALSSAQSAIDLLSSSEAVANAVLLEKAWTRKCAAIYGLRRWEEAESAYSGFLDLVPAAPTAKESQARVKQRISEANSGSYDFRAMYLTSQKERSRLDAADYQGPVSVKQSRFKGGGWGIFTNRAVETGELLMVIKAITIVYKEDCRKS